MPPRDPRLETALAHQAERTEANRRARHLAVAGLLFFCSGIAALFAFILTCGTLLALAAGQYINDGMGLAFALTWDLATFVCAICTWRVAAKPVA